MRAGIASSVFSRAVLPAAHLIDIRLSLSDATARSTHNDMLAHEANFDQKRIPALDGLRAVAISLVLLFHLRFTGIPGPLGVTIFFVLSGYLITWILLKEELKTGSISFSAFYWRRVLRIIPPLLVATILGLTLYSSIASIPWTEVVAANSFWMNYRVAFQRHDGMFLAVTWSLAVEEQFYILWPAAFWYLRGNPKRRITAVAIGIASIWVWRFVLVSVFHVASSYIYNAFDTRVDSILVGCLAALFCHDKRNHSIVRLLSAQSSWFVALLGATTFCIAAVSTRTPKYLAAELTLEPLLIACAMVNLIFVNSRIRHLLELKPLLFLGSISYSLYLYHGPIATMIPAWSHYHSIVLVLSISVAAAALSFMFIERPILRYKSVFWWRRPADVKPSHAVDARIAI